MKITLKEIAKEAGVSQSTISRMVTGNAAVSYELEQKVLQASQKLGVEFPKRSNHHREFSNVIGLLVADLSNPYFLDIMRGVTSEAKVLDYGVQIFETNEDVQFEEETFRSIGNFNLCGLILCASRISDARLLNFYHQCNLPIVLVNRYVKDPSICCITVDYHKSLFQATTHLINLGHRRIAYLSGPSKSDTSLNR
jgi:DNA-binding LacI/PurR family transcriptional regulator